MGSAQLAIRFKWTSNFAHPYSWLMLVKLIWEWNWIVGTVFGVCYAGK